MGLLTDPSAGQGKVIKLLLKYYTRLCVLLYIVGTVYFCLLASPQFNGATYFSENALLPGLVKSEFRNDVSARLYYEELMDELKKYDNSIPYPWLLAKFRQIGLDTYTHNFTLNYPLGVPQKFHGKNVYAILRAPRAASTEALVLSVPYRPPTSVYPPTAPSIAIMLAFAKFAISEKYWAKDIIFLITEHEQLGVQSWLEAYHGVTCGRKDTLLSGDMKGRAGAIQAAINLEFHDTEIGQIDIKIEGLNGQVPNLDLFNLAGRMCIKEGIQLTFKNRIAERVRTPFRDWDLSLQFIKSLPKKMNIFYKEWTYNFQTMMSMVATQSSGIPNGNHGLFYRFGIQAVTLEGFSPVNHRVNRVGFYTLGRILEGTFRSLNNLLERFHQSFFFYLLSSSDRYISIGLYIPAICLIAATLFIKSYAKWCQLHENSTNGKSEGEGGAGDMSLRNVDPNSLKQLREMHKTMSLEKWKAVFDVHCTLEDKNSKNNISLGHICLVFVLSHILGFSLIDFPKILSQIGLSYGYSTEMSVLMGFVTVFIVILFVPLFITKPCYNSMALLNILSLIELGTTLICISMYNISLAMFLAVIYTPLALLINPSRCGICNKVQKLLWILAHPFIVLLITVCVSTFITFPGEPAFEIFIRTIEATKKALLFSIVDSIIYGNWLYNVITGIFVSNWLCLWYVTFSKPKEIEVTKEKKEN